MKYEEKRRGGQESVSKPGSAKFEGAGEETALPRESYNETAVPDQGNDLNQGSAAHMLNRDDHC